MSTASSRWFRFNIWLHRWTSLIATLPFLILCLTGTVLIFHEEIDAAMGVVPAVTSASGAQQPLSQSLDSILADNPGHHVLSAGVAPIQFPGILLVATAPEGTGDFDHAEFHFASLATGESLGQVEFDKTLTGFLLELHAQWFLGPVGELIGALIALLVLLSLFSGVVVYMPYVKRVAFGILRRGRGPRLLQIDLHNFIGSVVLGWALVVTVTGFLLGFSTLALGVVQMRELPRLQQKYAGPPVDAAHPSISVDQAFAAARAVAGPGWRASTAIFPGTSLATNRHFTMILLGPEGSLQERVYRIALVDAVDGEVDAVVDLPWYLQAILLAEPLHFGDYGGLLLKLLWTACTWLTLIITANGAWLWWDRRRRLRRP